MPRIWAALRGSEGVMRRVATRKELNRVLVFSGSYLAISSISILRTQNYEFLLYLLVMTAIIIAVLGVHRRAGLSENLLWGFGLWGLFHMVGGLCSIPDSWHTADTTGVVYNWRIIPGYLKYDQLVHGYGSGLTTWLCWQALAARTKSNDGSPIAPTLGMLSLCATAGMGFGALNEVIEFFASILIPTTNVGDYENTGWDLVANLVGATIAVLCIRSKWAYYKVDS